MSLLFGRKCFLGLLVGLVGFAVLALPLLAAPSADARARVTGPKTVKPGKMTWVKLRGFDPGTRVAFFLQPTANRGGNGFGISRRKRYPINRKGRAWIRYRMPGSYFGCLGQSCDRHRWRPGSRVDINLCVVEQPKCRRHVARIRG